MGFRTSWPRWFPRDAAQSKQPLPVSYSPGPPLHNVRRVLVTFVPVPSHGCSCASISRPQTPTGLSDSHRLDRPADALVHDRNPPRTCPDARRFTLSIPHKYCATLTAVEPDDIQIASVTWDDIYIPEMAWQALDTANQYADWELEVQITADAMLARDLINPN